DEFAGDVRFDQGAAGQRRGDPTRRGRARPDRWPPPGGDSPPPHKKTSGPRVPPPACGGGGGGGDAKKLERGRGPVPPSPPLPRKREREQTESAALSADHPPHGLSRPLVPAKAGAGMSGV